MGASADEVIDDYMLTFFNYYGIEPGIERYDSNMNNICSELAAAFQIDSIRSEGVDLARCACEYLLGLGLTK